MKPRFEDLNLDLKWEEDERWEDVAEDKASDEGLLETSESEIETREASGQEPPSTPHDRGTVHSLPAREGVEDDMSKVAAPAGE